MNPTPLRARQDARLSDRIREFFYREEVPYSLAIIRMLMPLVLLWPMGLRWAHARELYSADGAPTPLGFVYGWPDLLPTFSGEVAVLLHSLLLLTLLTSALGWCARFSLIVSTVLFAYLNVLDSISTITKYSVIAAHVMLLLSLSHCGAVWSVDSWLAGDRRNRTKTKIPWPGEPSVARPRFTVWPQRLIQLMIGVVYLGSALTKMHTPEFFSGDQMTYWMLSDINHKHPLGEIVSQYPAFVITSAYLTITWEITFIFLAWRGLGRLMMIGIGVVFHLMTNLLLGLYVFPLVCFVIYFAFLEEDDFRRLSARLRRVRRSWKLPRRTTAPALASPPLAVSPRRAWLSVAAFSAVLVVTGVAGVIAEHRLDPYGIRRPEGRYTLKEIPADLARQWIGQNESIRPVDKIFSFDVGTVIVGNCLANRKQVFQQGESLVAQVSLNPPHEDMWIECNLHDSENRLIDRLSVVVGRETFRGHFRYDLTPVLAPGDYQLVLNTAGQEVARRGFRLEAAPDPRPALGN